MEQQEKNVKRKLDLNQPENILSLLCLKTQTNIS